MADYAEELLWKLFAEQCWKIRQQFREQCQQILREYNVTRFLEDQPEETSDDQAA